MDSIPDLQPHCTCKGACGICQEAIGYDPETVCPDCPIHGYSNLAKRKRRTILEELEKGDSSQE